MKIKVNVGWIQVTCEGENKAKVLKDLAEAQEFVRNNLDVKTPKPKKKVVRKPKKAVMKPPKAPVVTDQKEQKAPKNPDPIVAAAKDTSKIVVK